MTHSAYTNKVKLKASPQNRLCYNFNVFILMNSRQVRHYNQRILPPSIIMANTWNKFKFKSFYLDDTELFSLISISSAIFEP